MKKIISFLLLTALCLSSSAYAQKNKTIVGTITAFDGADNFYLTIVDKQGETHQGLCSDDTLCEKLVNNLDDPNLAGYKGKKVKVTVGQGKQYDGAGNVMGTMDAFENIELMQ